MADIKQFLSDNETMDVNTSTDVSYSITEVLDDVHRAINAKFVEDKWSDGSLKSYFDLSRVMATAIKLPTDIDTKDLGMHAENKEAVPAVGLLRGAVKNHLKVNDYGTLFNRVKDDNLVDIGHVILKKTSEGTEIVDIRNIIRPADAMNIQECTFVEKHVYTWEDMLARKNRWKEAWSEVKQVWEKMQQKGRNNFTVYEMWTIDDFDGQTTKGKIMYLDNQISKPEDTGNQDEWNPQIELERTKTPYTEPIEDERKRKRLEKEGFLIDGEMPLYPYDEQRLFTIPGRWLGAGVYEITAPLREAYNQTMNNKLHYDELFGKGLFVHAKGVGGKRLTQAALQALENSGVVELQNGAKLEQLRLQSLTADFIASADKFFEFARQLLGLTAQGTGEELPASMSATSAMINQQRAKTLYDTVIEKQSLLWTRWFSRFELKDILENLTAQKWVKIEGNEQELKEILIPFARNYINAKIGEQAPVLMNQGIIDAAPEVSPDDIEATVNEAVDKLLEQKSIFVEFTKKMFKQARYYLEFYISGEGFNKIERLKTLAQLKADAMVNPNSTMDVGAIEDEILDIVGVGVNRFKRKPGVELLPPVAPQQTPQLGQNIEQLAQQVNA